MDLWMDYNSVVMTETAAVAMSVGPRADLKVLSTGQ